MLTKNPEKESGERYHETKVGSIERFRPGVGRGSVLPLQLGCCLLGKGPQVQAPRGILGHRFSVEDNFNLRALKTQLSVTGASKKYSVLPQVETFSGPATDGVIENQPAEAAASDPALDVQV